MTTLCRNHLRALALVVTVGLIAGCGSDDGEALPATTTTGTAASQPGGASTTAAPPPTTVPSAGRDLCPYRDMGIWVDVYDYVPAFTETGVPPVTPDDVDVMRDMGVQTLYFQLGKDDPRSPQIVTDEARATEFVRRARAAGIAVVAWYLPTHRDHELDLERTRAMATFEVDGRGLDGVALDIEGTDAEPDVTERNRKLLELMAELDRVAGDTPVGSIVYPPVSFDVLNPTLWPDFPWKELAPFTDVWLPMVYWTYRRADSPYRDPHLYTVENTQRLRDHLDDRHAVVHVIGGIGDKATLDDYEAFRRAADEVGAIGFSVYDYDTLAAEAWPLLRTPATC